MNRWMGLATAVMLAACGDEAVTVEQADGVTLEDVGGDAPDIAAPDVRVDDTGADPADAVHSETGVDAGPDAVVDDAGHVDVDGSPLTGQCLGPFDGAARAEGAAELVHVASIEAAGDCARDGSELVSCTATLVGSRMELTPGCANCAAQLAACTADECYETCEADPAGPECGFCYRESGCEEAYAVCSGLEPWAWEPVCDQPRWGAIQLARDCIRARPLAEFESCMRERISTESAECIDCAVTYSAVLLAECDTCIQSPDTDECVSCNQSSSALRFAEYCATVPPATF